MGLDENALVEKWQKAPAELRFELEQELAKALIRHAAKVCHLQIGFVAASLCNYCAYLAIQQLKDGKFRHESKFTTWFEAIVRRRCTEHLLGKIKHQKVIQPSADGSLPDVAAPTYAHEAREQVEKLREGLEKDERKLFDLKLQGYTDVEIAEALGLRRNAVKVRWQRLVERLRHRQGFGRVASKETE